MLAGPLALASERARLEEEDPTRMLGEERRCVFSTHSPTHPPTHLPTHPPTYPHAGRRTTVRLLSLLFLFLSLPPTHPPTHLECMNIQ